jgi:hypothetical protein
MGDKSTEQQEPRRFLHTGSDMRKRTPEQDELHGIFHAAWGQAIDSPSYDKEVWRKLDVIIGLFTRPDSVPVVPSEDPMEQWRGFPVGHWLHLLVALRQDRELPKDAIEALEKWRNAKLAKRAAKETG